MKIFAQKISTPIKTAAAVVVLGAISLTSTNAWSHFVSLDGDIEVNDTEAYWKTGDGLAVSSTSGCVLSSDRTDDNKINACEGIEDEAPVEEVAEAPAPAPEPPEPVATVETLTIDGLGLFDYDSDQLTAEGSTRINDLLAQLQEFKGVLGIEVSGHTDSRGSEEYNQGLSERRAATVQGILASAYPDVAINAIGLGESAPIASNANEAGRAQNRRVEVRVDVSKMTFE